MIGLRANWSLVFDVLKAWYIDWLLIRNPQAKEERKRKKMHTMKGLNHEYYKVVISRHPIENRLSARH